MSIDLPQEPAAGLTFAEISKPWLGCLLCGLSLASSFAHSASSVANTNQSAKPASLHAAVTPTTTGALRWHDHGIVQKRYFATILNDSDQIATNCRISLFSDVPLVLDYYATHPLTNEFIGPVNVPVDIPARGQGTFGFTLTLPEDRYFPRQRLTFDYVCDNRSPAITVANVNDVRLGGGTQPSPSVVMSLTHEGLPGILHLTTQDAVTGCPQTTSEGQRVAPCATGEFILALQNLESEPVTLTVDVLKDDYARVQHSWICRVDDAGVCRDAWQKNTLLQPTLGPSETAAFAIALLTFDDYSFRPRRFWRRVQVLVKAKGKRAGVPRRVKGYNLLQLRNKRFEWLAERQDGVVQVHGSVMLENDCKRAQLQPQSSAGVDPQVLHLELSISEAAGAHGCTPGLVKQKLTLTTENPEAIIVSVHSERGTLKLPVQATPD